MSVPEQPRVTTRSLAAELGLSRTTISRALRDDRRVADATRERVLRAARKKGYRADAVFSALAANRWRGLPDGVRSTLGLLNLNHSPLKSETVESGTETARSLGYGLDIVNLADYPDQQAAFRVFRARGIRSVLLWMPSDQDFQLEADVSNFIVLAAPIGMKQLPVHTVSSNHYRASQLVTRKLAERGFQRPGLVIGLSPRNQNLDMVVGAYCAEWDRGLFGGKMPAVLEPRWEPTRFYEWLEKERPDVIISASGLHFVERSLAEVPEPVFRKLPVACVFGNQDKAGAYLSQQKILETALFQLHAHTLANEYGLPAEPTVLFLEPHWRDGEMRL